MPEFPLFPGYYDDWLEIQEELNEQTDRGAAVVGHALLETKIEEALHYFLPAIPGSKEVKLPSNFTQKVEMAYALGFLGEKSKEDSNKIGEIRNRLAHKLKFKSFDDPDIASLCEKRSLANYRFINQPSLTVPRERFIQSVVNIVHFLYAEVTNGTGIGNKPDKSP